MGLKYDINRRGSITFGIGAEATPLPAKPEGAVVGDPIPGPNYIVAAGSVSGRKAGLRTGGSIDLYLQRKPGDDAPVRHDKLVWCADWADATRMPLEMAVAYCLQIEDAWIEQVVWSYVDPGTGEHHRAGLRRVT